MNDEAKLTSSEKERTPAHLLPGLCDCIPFCIPKSATDDDDDKAAGGDSISIPVCWVPCHATVTTSRYWRWRLWRKTLAGGDSNTERLEYAQGGESGRFFHRVRVAFRIILSQKHLPAGWLRRWLARYWWRAWAKRDLCFNIQKNGEYIYHRRLLKLTNSSSIRDIALGEMWLVSFHRVCDTRSTSPTGQLHIHFQY